MLERRGRELIGLGLVVTAFLFTLMLASYSPEDPGWMVATQEPARNYLGRFGSGVSSTLVILIGRGAWAVPLILSVWGARFLLHRGADRALGRVVFAVLGVALASAYASTLAVGEGWPHTFGLGGLFGDTVVGALIGIVPGSSGFSLRLLSFVTFFALIAMLLYVTGFDRHELKLIRHRLIYGSVMVYSMLMQQMGKGSAVAMDRARDLAERRRSAREEARSYVPPVTVAPPLAAPPASAYGAPQPMVARSASVVRRAEPALNAGLAPQPLQVAQGWNAPATLRAEPRQFEPVPDLPKEKVGFLARMRRAVEPEPELIEPEPLMAAEEGHQAPGEERIRARISDAIRARARGPSAGYGAAAASTSAMTPLQAAVAARRAEPPVLRPRRPATLIADTRPFTRPPEPPVHAAQAAAIQAEAAQLQAQMMQAPPMQARQVPLASAPSAALRAPARPASFAQAEELHYDPVARWEEPEFPMVDEDAADHFAPPEYRYASPEDEQAWAERFDLGPGLHAGFSQGPGPAGLSAPVLAAPAARPGQNQMPLRREEPPMMASRATHEDASVAAPASFAAPVTPTLPKVTPPVASPATAFAAAGDDWREEDDFDAEYDPSPMAAPRPAPVLDRRPIVQNQVKKPIAQSSRAVAEAQPDLRFEEVVNDYELPPLALLAQPSESGAHQLSDEALEENARMLESVLDDYGVKGEIVSVRPGPVVTMYELEPAPGLKASRVIGLSDDIARSMSALSARVSTVPGRSVIGIELPNNYREKVALREIIASREFGDGQQRLPLALGKDIGGTPVVANLAKMPHLLIAGTTGSGKSVAINTMILSLLYKLTPEECRLIMIDPKMLELSVYDGIPHLLSPVVTDPKKAVVALKWVVGEMEERYRKMSKMGVRNIEGYNGRVREAMARGEMFKRTIQTGFDDETGDPVFETEEFAPQPFPYIVVIVDEMADLMMVAGKEIEACIQRLAQMARASGIHLIMATQRPSVDVITGTIKANFPTRISFQVTSKIDSRTILGEMGAEQLLGQGDMLYMGNGQRITRIHGPFVSDEEVEEIVNHLKSFGPPSYMSGVVEGPDEDSASDIDQVLGLGGNTDGEDALYDQAVAIVAKDRKCSTSYIQRKLGIGYNKAARLVEQMEENHVVTSANHVGKREILIPEA
ncbi:DNA translocase FtsK [Pseudogemmobacter faecipullorum]|nr:DNA translocase FtsK [Pseudogemmobacter faecipullorum]